MLQRLKPYLAHVAVFAFCLTIGYGISQIEPRKKVAKVLPTSAAEFVTTSAMVVLPDMLSGGSGVILRSSEQESVVLTNKHVCEVIQGGGMVVTMGQSYKITHYKLYPKHDLCLIKVASDLKITTVVADKDAKLYTHAYVSGHPALLPHVLTEGYFSNKKKIDILVDIKPCSDEEFEQNSIVCLFMGGIPVIKSFDGQLVTATIMPGSSGSGVFNEAGEISGLIFAGSSQGLSYGFMIPLSFIKDFLANEAQYKWRVPKKGSMQKFLSSHITKKIFIGCISNKLYSEYCNE